MMSPRTTLVLSSILFAVLWTAGMLWWSAPLDAASTVILIVAGGIVGLLWYWLFGRWFRWHFGLDRNYRRTGNP
jgi:membrane protein DedA with SNARE-associated domain